MLFIWASLWTQASKQPVALDDWKHRRGVSIILRMATNISLDGAAIETDLIISIVMVRTAMVVHYVLSKN